MRPRLVTNRETKKGNNWEDCSWDLKNNTLVYYEEIHLFLVVVLCSRRILWYVLCYCANMKHQHTPLFNILDKISILLHNHRGRVPNNGCASYVSVSTLEIAISPNVSSFSVVFYSLEKFKVLCKTSSCFVADLQIRLRVLQLIKSLDHVLLH